MLATSHAANFSITSGSNSTAQTLNNGENGSVSANATLTVSGVTTTITVNGNASITNAGSILQTGTARTIDANTANITLTINNSGTISSVGTNETIRLAQTATLNLTNQSGAFLTSNNADAVRPGNNSTITNYGTISASPSDVAAPSGSDGVDLRTQRTGITINNYATISGRHGIATDGANVGPSSVTVNNYSGGTISAFNGSGLNVDGVSTTATANVTNSLGATIKGGVSSNSTAGDGDGIDVDGVLTLNNSGDILGLGAKGANNPEAVAAGGGSITNTSTGNIVGSSLTADAPNGDNTKIGSGILIDDSNGGNAVAATTVTNSGLIRGKSGFGIKIVGTFADTITNNSGGTIRGNGTSAVIQTGGGNDTVSNAGTITHDGGVSQTAISTEDGNDTVNIIGGNATVTGGIDGGNGTNTLNLQVGGGNTFSFNGTITNFTTTNVQSGRFNLSGSINPGSAINITGGSFNYTGSGSLANDVTVNGGEFKSNGGNFTGNLTLASGTVSGTNLSGVALSFGSNQTLSPGNSPGTLTTGDQTWAGAGTYLWEINQLAGDGGTQGSDPGWDFVNINGALLITATNLDKFSVNIDSLALLTSWNNSQNYTFVIATASGGISGFDASAFQLNSTAFADQHSLGGGSFSVAQNGNNVELKFTAVPEPSTWVLLIGGLVLLIAPRFRRSGLPSRK